MIGKEQVLETMTMSKKQTKKQAEQNLKKIKQTKDE